MKAICLDVETSILNKGNAYDHRNKLCYIGLFDGDTYQLVDIDYSGRLPGEALRLVQDRIDSFDCIVGFNLKFDLSWLRRYGIDFSKHSVWDCQLVEFILDTQSNPYPSLDGVASKYSLASKLSVVDNEYWSKNIDTPDIPKDILEEYLKQDLKLTWKIYQLQVKEIE